MSSDSQLLEGNQVRIGKQIVLPLSKAVEISLRGVRVRFWRSLITMSGIILAIAFMVSIWAGSAVLKGLWVQEDGEVIVHVKSEPSKLTLEDGSEIDVVRQRVIRQSVGFVLRSKGLKGGREKEASGRGAPGNPAGDPSAPPITAAAAAAVSVDNAGSKDMWLVGLSLCVAVVGIVNAMLMSVTERFREIGTMKCLGALDTFIVKLFLLESVFLGFIGTVMGIASGLVLTALFSTVTYWQLRSILFVALPWNDVLVGMIIALVAGTGLSVLGAIYPAVVAARMEPVVAMSQNA